MILAGQGVEAFGLLIMTGDLNWMNRGYSIFCVGVGCVSMGFGMCILTAVVVPEMIEAISNLPEGHKYGKEAISVYVSNLCMFTIAICEGVGFFCGCFFGIGWSYNFAFWGSSFITCCFIFLQITVYWIACGFKPAAPEKKKDGDEETDNLIKKETAPNDVKS